MNIVVTGGAGFIGNYLIRSLLLNGHEVVCIDVFSPSIHGEKPILQLPKDCKVHTNSYGDINYYKNVYKDADVIFLLAAETGMGESQFNNSLYCKTNILATASLIDYLRHIKSNAHVILPSSCRIYGEGHYLCPLHGEFSASSRNIEDLKQARWSINCPICQSASRFIPNSYSHRSSATSTYAVSKYAQECILLSNSYTADYDCTIMRLQNVYGAGQSLHNAYTGLISVFSQRIANQMNLEIYEEGFPSRDFVYVSDVCKAMLDVMNNRQVSSYKIYDVGSGVASSITSVAQILVSLAKTDTLVNKSRRFRFGDILNGSADIRLIHDDLQWSPTVDLSTGLSLYWSWLITQSSVIDHSESVHQKLLSNNILLEAPSV